MSLFNKIDKTSGEDYLEELKVSDSWLFGQDWQFTDILRLLPVLNFKSHKKLIDRTRHGSTTFVKSSVYNPVILNNTSTPIEFDSEERKSLDISIYRHLPGKGFSVSFPGIYTINVEWHVDIPKPGAMTFVQLDLYKNGVIYKRIGREAILSVLSAEAMTLNVYHLEANLQGSKDIDLTPDDIFTIQLTHDKAAGFGPSETHTGYIDIDFYNKWSLN